MLLLCLAGTPRGMQHQAVHCCLQAYPFVVRKVLRNAVYVLGSNTLRNAPPSDALSPAGVPFCGAESVAKLLIRLSTAAAGSHV